MFQPLERTIDSTAEPSAALDLTSSTFSNAVEPPADWSSESSIAALSDGTSPFDHFADEESGTAKKPVPKAVKKADPVKKGAKKEAEPVEPPKPPEGLFPGVQDLTKDYGKLASGDRSSTTDAVILHRTEAAKGSSTLSGYKNQIANKGSRGAQYLIDENGTPMLITPSNKKTTHVQMNNSTAVGIEVTGAGVNLAPSMKDGTLRKKLEDMTLSPEYKARLLGYDDKTLNQLVKSNMFEGESAIYEDVNGKQKRSVWNLTSELAKKYKLDMTDLSTPGANESGDGHYTNGQLPDFSAHEHVQSKSMGEGEPMIEFMRERGKYPKLVAAAQKKLDEMIASGASPEELARMQAMVNRETGTLSALNVDGTQKEIDAVKAEKDGGKPGEATLRENSRVDFYDNFYDRIGALKKATK